MIKTVIFDMGGVIITLDENEAGKRFIELGMKEFAEKMDPYKQVGLNSWKRARFPRRNTVGKCARRLAAR